MNADGPSTALVVRAHGVLAGNVGPIMQVWANGVLIDTVEVRATQPTDYPFTVPGLQTGTRLDVVFTNDATVGTSNRDLFVTHLAAGRTLVLPTASSVTYDRGVGAAAFDGVDVISGRSAMGWTGALRLTWPEPNLTSSVTVRASGTLADGVGPVMALRVDGVVVGSTEVRSTEPADHVFAVPPLAVGSRIDVVYTNDATINGQDRNLSVHYLMAGTTVLLPNAPGVMLDVGSGLAAFDGVGVQPGQASITGNGALRGTWPAANMTDTLTVRASGTLAGNAGPLMQVLVNGVVLGSTEVRSTTPTDLRFATLPLQPGAQVQVRNTNAGSLNLAYAMQGNTVLRPTDAGVQVSASTALDGPWPQPNLTDTITVRARGVIAGNEGPIMQVLIDGVLVGSPEVRNTDFADFSFPAFPMQPGRKVDVAFTNDAIINGADRNLFVAYLISGSTFQLPNASGNTFDRGNGAAAFDNNDVNAGSSTLASNGALRTTWPQPNITSTVTVRASGTLAGNVGPVMRLWVDGVAVSSVEVRAPTPTDYTLPTPSLQPGSRVQITFDNPATVAGAQRRLDLAYLMAGTTVLKPSSSGAVYADGNLQASWPTANLTDTLTIRAHGVLAGNVGPVMQVLVDGVLVATQEVRAAAPTDYRFLVPALRPGTKIDVTYVNDGSVNGVDRNLFVSQLMSGNTFQLPTAPSTTYDRGLGAAAFDGLDLIPSTGAVHSNGAVRLTWPEPNLTSSVTVRASGTLADGVGPVMALRVDGVVVGSTEVRSTEPADHVFAVPPLAVGSRIDVVYANDATINGQDRNLSVHYLMAGTTVLLPNAPGVMLDVGSGLAAFDGVGVQPGQASITSNGALRGRWPAANMTDTLTVRASGTLAGNVGPLMQVLVNGVVLGTTEVRSTTPTDLRFATLPLQPGAQVQVRNTNAGRLNLAYAMAGKTVLRPTDAGVQASTASPMLGEWPQPNLTDTLTVRARGVIAGNEGPIMQVLIDGVLVGSPEVRNTDFADFSFPAFPMQPGRKVDVAFTNDAIINGADRNLFVAYLISGSTFQLPNASGNTFDRGNGAAAFDNNDVNAGSSTLASNGALRTTWPQPNITSTVTVRASGTLAGNVGPVMRLWVDGVAVSSVEVRAPTPTDYTLPTPSLQPGSRVQITFDNPATVAGAQRRLDLAYLMAGTTVLKPSSSGAVYADGNLQASWPTANLTDTLTIRAHGVLAGNVGPVMQVLVDGVLVATQEVRAAAPTDYRFLVPALRPGTKIDVTYVNDGSVNGVDRNLFVSQLMSGNTFQLPTAPSTTYDRGLGAAAFDGLDLIPSTGAVHSNGAVRLTWPEPNLTSSVTVRASGTLADGVGPVMALRVDGVVVGSTEVRSTEPADHVFAVPPLAVGSRIDVVYTNDATINGQDRNLSVHYLMAGTTVLLPNAPGVMLDVGSGLAAFDGVGVQPGQASITSNGALRGRWPAANMTDTLTVRASGTLAGNAGPLMQVLVNGVVLGTTEVRSTTPTDLRFATLPLQPGAQVQVRNTNAGNLNLAYAMHGNTVLRPTDAGTQASPATPLQGAWPQPNLIDSITVRARGSLAGGVGPIMQVHVDGVLVGSTEVRSTDFADYSFPAFAMQPGRKVDVAFTNDAFINGADRNLFVAYLISGSTFQLPNANGNTLDRGSGAAAFDNNDVIAGSGTLASNGALRTTWPQPNITSTVTIRASGTLAGNVGPIMRLWVDGVAVSSVEVRATTPTDYSMAVPAIQPGSRVDLAYINDAVVEGVDRNLTVHYMQQGNTFVLPNTAGVRYDLGADNAAFDGADTLPGQTVLGLPGALRLAWPSPNVTDSITVRASANLALNIGALMQLRVDGVVLGTVEVRSSTGADYAFAAPRLSPGSRVDLAFVNDLYANGEDRNLFIQYIKAQGTTLVTTGAGVQTDAGTGEAAFDGIGTSASTGALTVNGAMRFTMPAPKPVPADLRSQYSASRFLQQAGFGPTLAEVNRLAGMSRTAWLAEQMAMPPSPDFVASVQAKFDQGDAWRPNGSQYSPDWVAQRFWQAAANGPDVLRKRVAFALHQTLMVSQTDSNLFSQVRAYAAYMDTLNRHAFGNYRQLLEDVALSPAMGIYLSHMRNRPEDLSTGRMPDENFAREVMQLFSIGLQELNIDGTLRLDAQGQPMETYTNDDVMAMAKVFTGWSWAFPDAELTAQNFRAGQPGTTTATDTRIDVLKMKAYPGQHSAAEKRLFIGKPNALVIPAGTGAAESVRLALDALFLHPNVGPFIGRQLIQRLVTSHPSNGYVARVSSVFNNNGSGVRGDLAAVVRAILLDPEAINPPASSIGKLREPVMRVAHWMRSFGATSASGQFMLASELETQGQRAMYAPSVFGYFRPGFVPPNTSFSANRITVPEFQIVNESTTALWVNTALAMAGQGLGWTGTGPDVRGDLQPLADLYAAGDVDGLIERLNLLLYAGGMTDTLKQDLLEAVTSVSGNDPASHLNRARVALFLALASPEYLVQR